MLAVSEETEDQSIKVKGLHSIQKTGIIYLVEHEMFDGWLKCGMTVNMKSRLKSYNLCDPLKRYTVVASKVVKDRRKAEIDLIRELTTQASMKNGEWLRFKKTKLNLSLKKFDAYLDSGRWPKPGGSGEKSMDNHTLKIQVVGLV